jgi:sulfur carrier protein
MHIVLNGKNLETVNDATVEKLLEQVDMLGKRLAVMVDDAIVRKADYADAKLTEGCKVEIISMVGGG